MSTQAAVQLYNEADSNNYDNETKHPRIVNLVKIQNKLNSFKDLMKNLKKEINGCLASSQEAVKTVGEINDHLKGEKRKP